MAVINVNPTSNELAKLKKRYRLALRGHKLLKDKLDSLMRTFLESANKVQNLRKDVEDETIMISRLSKQAKRETKAQIFENAVASNKEQADIIVSQKHILNISVPKFSVSENEITPQFGYAFTSSKLDIIVDKLKILFEKMIKLAEYEYETDLLAKEIMSTRRRVNSLEHILIPDLSDTIQYISSKLEEADRANRIRLIKVKDLVLSNK